MNPYIRRVKYYETDKMGITHHSNYVRWLEEARLDYLQQLGFGMKWLESQGVTSPVVSLECRYKHTTTFDDEIRVEVFVDSYTGVKLSLRYVVTNTETGTVVLTANSSHCFINGAGSPIALRKQFPAFDAALKAQIQPKD